MDYPCNRAYLLVGTEQGFNRRTYWWREKHYEHHMRTDFQVFAGWLDVEMHEGMSWTDVYQMYASVRTVFRGGVVYIRAK